MTGTAGALRPAAVSVAALTLTNFRNWRNLSARFEPGLVALVGPNGVGKTNIIEAISLLSPGRGLRRAAFDELPTRAAGAPSGVWAVAAIVDRDGASTRIGTGSAAPGDAGAVTASRRVRIDGAAEGSPEAMLDYLRVLWLTPATDALFTGPAGDRRRFLDRLVLAVDPAHARRIRDLDRLLTQRNRLLNEDASAAWLDALEAQLAEVAVAVALARSETVGLVSARLERENGAFPRGRIGLSGAFETFRAGRSAAEAETGYRACLAAARGIDRAAGRTLDGPHRSDLDVVFAAKDVPAAVCSTGEQKALLIGLALAQAEIVASVSGMTPILLLDEVAAHLDPARRAALFERLIAGGGQTIMTGTDAELFRHPSRGVAIHAVAPDGPTSVG